MLDKIKSLYFLKNFLELIDESKKLNIFKYNKSLQNKIDISIINYKILSGRYIIYESKNKVKEYLSETDALVFEGNYVNKKRNGKGKEYDHGNMIFEGEYLNGKRNGKGKEYYYDDRKKLKIKFEGEYLNGKKWNGKGYSYKEYLNGCCVYEIKEGKGFIKDYNIYNYNMIFAGEYLNGLKNGKGREYYDNGVLKFDGEYLNDKKWNGKGHQGENDIIYEIINGKGVIKELYPIKKNKKLEIEYLNGEKNGKGKEYDYKSELKFEGNYLNNKKHGKGKEYNIKGELIFEGEYLYNYKIKGKEYVNNILQYEGDFLFNKKYNGKGYDSNGKVIYELINGNGKVKEYNEYNSKLFFDGEYLNGKKNGYCKEYYYDGDIKFEGNYLNGKRNGKGKEYYRDRHIKYQGEYLDGKEIN